MRDNASSLSQTCRADWGLGTKRLGDISVPVLHTASALSAPSGHLPLEGKAMIRGYRPLTCSEAATLRAVPFPRIVIPSEVEGSLLHCRHMHACALTQTTPWCFPLFSLTHVLPVCKKDFSASALMTHKKDDSLTSSFIPLRRVVPLRGTLSCAFGAALLQGPTRIIGVTGDLRLKSHFRASPFIKIDAKRRSA